MMMIVMMMMMMMMMIVIMKINLEGSLFNLFDTIAQRLNTLSKWLKRSRIRTGGKKKNSRPVTNIHGARIYFIDL